MHKFTILLLLALLAVSPVAAQPDDWQRFDNGTVALSHPSGWFVSSSDGMLILSDTQDGILNRRPFPTGSVLIFVIDAQRLRGESDAMQFVVLGLFSARTFNVMGESLAHSEIEHFLETSIGERSGYELLLSSATHTALSYLFDTLYVAALSTDIEQWRSDIEQIIMSIEG